MKNVIRVLASIMLISLIGYFISNAFLNQEISNFFSPITTLSTGVLILIVARNMKFLRRNWYFLAFVALFWGLADFVWMLMYNLFGIDPEESVFLYYVYALPNLFLVATGISYFYYNLKKWHRFQLVADAVAIFILTFLLIQQSIFIDMQFDAEDIHYFVSNMLYLFLDLLAFTIMALLVSSARVKRISNTMLMLIIGYFGFVLTDLVFVYQDIHGLYTPNGWVDSLYLSSIVMFGIAAVYDYFYPSLIEKPEFVKTPQNMGSSHRLVYLLVIPILEFFTGLISLQTMALVFVVILVYLFVSGYIQIAIRNEYLLKRQREMNEQLEEIVQQRTKEFQEANEQLMASSYTDSLCNIYNRKFFIHHIDRLIEENKKGFSIYYIDLDHFRQINEVHGQEMGDHVLKAISEKLVTRKSESTMVARVDGDEFGIIRIHGDDEVNNSEQTLVCHGVCEELMDLFHEPILVEGYAFHIEVSIGIARFPMDTNNRETLLKFASLALAVAKKNNQNQKCVVHSKSHSLDYDRRTQIQALLNKMNYDDELSLHYQPQYDIDGEHLVGVEALLRWNSSVLGFVSPGEFIPLAEESGAIVRIGRWVMDKASAQIVEWNTKHGMNLRVGINLSPLQFDSVDFFPFIEEVFSRYDLDPTWIDFEITETSAMNSGTVMEEIFTTLSGLGAQISIDDFGTGYSSLSYIKRFDIDQLKIAKELIDHIVENEDERLIIKAIIFMAKGMGLKTIAEGVESSEQYELLKELGCEAIQGYYFSRPLTKEAFEERYFRN
ncbi:MAG: EAL domain-containing protein [Vallitaleaceae bacterium]|nr:EAL domain-containing protein [Vallitaleaceae bacterium]